MFYIFQIKYIDIIDDFKVVEVSGLDSEMFFQQPSFEWSCNDFVVCKNGVTDNSIGWIQRDENFI